MREKESVPTDSSVIGLMEQTDGVFRSNSLDGQSAEAAFWNVFSQ